MSGRGELDHFRSAYCLWLAAAVALQWPGHLRWVRARGDERLMPLLVNRLQMPRLNVGPFALAGLALIAGLAAAVAPNWNPGWALIGTGIAALVYFSQVIGLPEVRRKPNTVPVVLLLMGAAGIAAGGESDRIAWLCLLAIKMLVAQIYFSSGLTKLKQSNWRWAASPTMQMALLRCHLRNDNWAALWLARHARACRTASALALVFEMTFWLVIPFPRLAWIYLPAGLIFHLGTAMLMRIHYWIYVVPAYVVFVVAR